MKKIALIISAFIIFSCSSENEPNDELNDPLSNENDPDIEYLLPFLTTNVAQNVTLDKATISGHVELAPLSVGSGIDGESNEIDTRGFIWGLNEGLNLDNGNKIEVDGDAGIYRTTLENLSPGTTYYFNTYATNANNESELGSEQSFTTAEEAPCDYETDNYLKPIFKDYDQPFIPDNVSLSDPGGYGDGNLQFEASASNSIVRIFIRLHQIDGNLPLSGTYKGVYDFDNPSTPSTNEMQITIQDYNGFTDFYPQGASNNADTEIYIQNTGDKVSFIFCDVAIGDYVLTGKYSYQVP